MFQPASPQHFTLRLGAFFLFFTLSCALHAQTWHELMEDNAPFEEVEVAFRQGLTEFQLETGKGIKPFERMKYFWEHRMDGEGQADYWNAYLAEFGQKGINTKDAGNWTSLGMAEWEAAYANNPGNGRVNSMTVDPSDADIVYIGAPSGGLWRSTDGGDSWSPLTDNLPTLGVNGIAVHPDDSGVIYIATGDGHGNSNYGMGVLKTTDGGTTWSTTGMVWSIEENIRSHGISMHPNDPETLFVWSTDGLYKTINGGLTWYLVRGGNVHDLEFHPTNPDVVYCCTDRFYKSTDGGEDFDLINDNLPSSSEAFRMELAVSPDDPDRVYILAANSWDYGFLGVYESQDQGDNWNTAADSPNILGWSMDGEGGGGQGWYDLDICVNPNDADHIFVGGVNLWESTNGGNSWSINAHWVLGNTQNYVHADIQYLGYKGNILVRTVASSVPPTTAIHSRTNRPVWKSPSTTALACLRPILNTSSQALKTTAATCSVTVIGSTCWVPTAWRPLCILPTPTFFLEPHNTGASDVRPTAVSNGKGPPKASTKMAPGSRLTS